MAVEDPITPRQLAFIQRIAAHLDMDEPTLHARAMAMHGKPLVDLARHEASALIEQLQAPPVGGQKRRPAILWK